MMLEEQGNEDARRAVFAPSDTVDSELYPRVSGDERGFFGEDMGPVTVDALMESFSTSGFQATHLSRAGRITQKMLSWRLSHDDISVDDADEEEEGGDGNFFRWDNMKIRERCRSRIFLSFTSNLMSSGLRESLVYLAKNKLIDVITTSAGGVEEDFVKCLGDFAVGTFHGLNGSELRQKGWNRIGNIYVPNVNYEKFEDWFQPILDECVDQQTSEGVNWTPSKLIRLMGSRVNDERSLYYWCAVNDIPVFCPGLTDGSIGDNLFFHALKNREKKLRIDVVEDIKRINELALHARRTGVICLGGGIAKHHTLNANLMRNGSEYTVYINTAQEFDGCDSGASPDEAISWGKIKSVSESVKVNCDATIAFPLLVATVFRQEAISRAKENREKDSWIFEHPIHSVHDNNLPDQRRNHW